MQRKDGDWEGKDLIKRGMAGTGQGKANKKLVLDEVYEEAKAAGKLNSVSIFGGANLPWVSKEYCQTLGLGLALGLGLVIVLELGLVLWFASVSIFGRASLPWVSLSLHIYTYMYTHK
jgi:hypothetical protein